MNLAAAVGLKMYRKKDGKEDKRRERAGAMPLGIAPAPSFWFGA